MFGVGDEATVGMTVEIVEAGLVHRAKLARAERLAGRRARLHLSEVSYFDPDACVWHEPDEQGTTIDVSFVRAKVFGVDEDGRQSVFLPLRGEDFCVLGS